MNIWICYKSLYYKISYELLFFDIILLTMTNMQIHDGGCQPFLIFPTALFIIFINNCWQLYAKQNKKLAFIFQADWCYMNQNSVSQKFWILYIRRTLQRFTMDFWNLQISFEYFVMLHWATKLSSNSFFSI